jgi:hypothetical protein
MARAALAGSRRGLLVYVGPGLLDEQQEQRLDAFRDSLETANGAARPQFLVRLVGDAAAIQNRGITRVSVRRDAVQPDRWHLLTQVKNYEDRQVNVALKLSINGRPMDQRQLSLAPNQLANEEEDLVWDQGGVLQAELSPADDLEADNRAVIGLPSFRPVRVAVFTQYSSFVKDFLPALASDPFVRAEVLTPGMTPDHAPDVAIYQGVSLPARPEYDSIYFLSGTPAAHSGSLRIGGWNPQHPVTRWIHTHDVSVRNPASLQVQPNDVVLASAEGNPPVPLILAREQNGHRLLIVGFDPQNSNLPLQSAYPLLIAGGIEWMTHSVVEETQSHSVGELDLPGTATRIVAPSGEAVPFANSGSEVHLLAAEPGLYRVLGPGGEASVAVNIPLLPSQPWMLTPLEAAAVEPEPRQQSGRDLWRWLAGLAAIALWLEWWLFYASRERRRIEQNREPAVPGDGMSLDLDPERAPVKSTVRDSHWVA